MKILPISILSKHYELMITREKINVYLPPSSGILNLLQDPSGFDKHYDAVKIINDNVESKPFFLAKFLGYTLSGVDYIKTYSTGLEVQVRRGDIRIHLGNII